MRSVVLIPVLALAATLTVTAQAFAQGTEAVPDEYGYVSAHAGAVAGPTAPAFGVEYGEHITRSVQAYLALSYFENLMQQPLRDDLTTLGTSLSAVTGDPWQLSGRDRGVGFIAGGKYLFGGGNVHPYVGGGGGIISLRREVTDANLGDVRNAVFNDFSVGEAALSLAPASLTRPLVEAAFGVGVVKGNAYFDIGYRYRRAFHLANTLDFSELSGGVGYKF